MDKTSLQNNMLSVLTILKKTSSQMRLKIFEFAISGLAFSLLLTFAGIAMTDSFSTNTSSIILLMIVLYSVWIYISMKLIKEVNRVDSLNQLVSEYYDRVISDECDGSEIFDEANSVLSMALGYLFKKKIIVEKEGD